MSLSTGNEANAAEFALRMAETEAVRPSSDITGVSDHGPAQSGPVGSIAKRFVDIVGALVGIILFGPLMIIIAVLLSVKGGPVFFPHQRVGFNGRKFNCLKFRSMVVDADRKLQDVLNSNPQAREQWERQQKLDPDPRVTPIGRFLRSTSLDELPQFFNVLAGSMSLVGPRPITEAEMERYGDAIDCYLRCRPGITGLWQVSGRSKTKYEDRVRHDRKYAKSQSVIGDIVIMLKTVVVVASRKGAA